MPIGLDLARTAKTCARAFDDALATAGGSAPVWQILISIKTRELGTQRALAAAVGIQGATLTHHLNAMESDGLVTRRRDPANRRVHLVELTEAGEELFHKLRGAAFAFDHKLRAGLSDSETAELARLLGKLRDNVG
jgi:MarR family transcriptional regulator, transcriptional regulator for hemolysin